MHENANNNNICKHKNHHFVYGRVDFTMTLQTVIIQVRHKWIATYHGNHKRKHVH